MMTNPKSQIPNPKHPNTQTPKSLVIGHWSLVILVLASCVAVASPPKAWLKTRQGNKQFEQGKFEEAQRRYKAAQKAAPDEPRLHFNIGDALYKQGKFKEAIAEFQKALSVGRASSPAWLQQRAHYNLGNCYFRQQKWQKAIDAYKRALDLNPNDHDAKYNLELALRKLHQQQQNPPPKPQQKPSQQPPSKQQKQKQQSKQPQTRKQQQQQSQKQRQPSRPQSQPPSLTREQALALLNALQGEEKKVQKRLLKKRTSAGSPWVEKDW